MDAAETTVQTTIPDVVHGFGLLSFYSSVEVAAAITTIVVVALAEWVISLAVITVTAATAVVNGLSS